MCVTFTDVIDDDEIKKLPSEYMCKDVSVLGSAICKPHMAERNRNAMQKSRNP
jgi:hypothetical protein